MASTSSFFDPTSPFVMYATQASRSVIIQLLRATAMNHYATSNEALHMYFNGTCLKEKITGFKQLLIQYIQICFDEYLSIHQQIVDEKLQKSDLNEDNMNHYVYYTMQKIMSENNGYKHLNCIFDGVMMYGVLQFKYVFASLTDQDYSMGGTSNNRGGNFSYAQLNIIRYVLQSALDKANENFHNLYANDDEYKNFRLKCEENDSCELKIEEAKQRLEQQAERIEQEAQAHECPCEHHAH